MTAGPTGAQDPIQQSEPAGQSEQSQQSEPVGSGLMEGPGTKGRDQRLGLVIAGIAGAALLVGGLIALVITMAG